MARVPLVDVASGGSAAAAGPVPKILDLPRRLLGNAGLFAAAHGTSTIMNRLIKARALHRVFDEHLLVTSTKAMTGHAPGAAGGIEAALESL
ncbi:hypothetical protein [Streptomyces sp. NPDC055099]